MANSVRIELLRKDNYDSWSMQVEALMTKNGTWTYASGDAPMPAVTAGNAASKGAAKTWLKSDKEAKSDLILVISPTELQHVRGCATSSDTWVKLQAIYASNGPARKVTLWKKLALQKLQEGEDVREHMCRFFDAVDKLSVMNVDINQNLLSILLLYSLPPSYENFRCAIESRDELPTTEVLKVKILEESEARGQKANDAEARAITAWRKSNGGWKKPSSTQQDGKDADANPNIKIKCFRCRKLGHKAAERPSKTGGQTKTTEADVSYLTSEAAEAFALKIGLNGGCTMCGPAEGHGWYWKSTSQS